MNILVINPGSTSTKWALYRDRTLHWKDCQTHSASELAHYAHVNEQLPMRLAATRRALERAMETLGPEEKIDVVIARGGLLKPTGSGVYEITDRVARDLRDSSFEHACNLGGLIARKIAEDYPGCPAYIADPEVVDEMMPEAKLTGIPSIRRTSIFHALNTKAVARRYAWSIGRRYEDMNLILVHLGGGISVGAHRKGRVVEVNNALNGDGPFSPERAGSIPTGALVDLCFSGKHTKREIQRMLNGEGGLKALLGTTDVAQISRLAELGEEPFKQTLDAMLYGVARSIGECAVALRGKVDATILTGGIAHSEYCCRGIKKWAGFIAPVIIRAGEDELDSLAFNAYSALTGRIPISDYNPA